MQIEYRKYCGSPAAVAARNRKRAGYVALMWHFRVCMPRAVFCSIHLVSMHVHSNESEHTGTVHREPERINNKLYI